MPGEVSGVRYLASKVTLTWSPSSAASRYDVVRDEIPPTFGPGEICFPDLSSGSLTDAEAPAAGSGFSYIVRGENLCGSGGYGFQARNGVPTVPRTTTVCP